ncbi:MULTISPECIES: hypothetical protein [Bacillus]|uniref:hypothetical protein n=1 Tax=Bacillus TaxID=1386 RepID=UPI00178CAA5F|nr:MULTISPECIES: hypothetical protein [Bacillus]MDR4910721.1 hypothetical protein [Bacillus subtilis]QOJ79898.1 hypothetical protein IHV08_10965 [Bacillus subtilis]UEG55533.1 hypothetical protein LK685_11760 [Bacillus sp. BC1-43]UJE04081.1 hypothetical protein HNV25_10900 [Bacillus subtilis]
MNISDSIKETVIQSLDQLESKINELFIYMENELPPITEKQWEIIDKKFSEVFVKSIELKDILGYL